MYEEVETFWLLLQAKRFVITASHVHVEFQTEDTQIRDGFQEEEAGVAIERVSQVEETWKTKAQSNKTKEFISKPIECIKNELLEGLYQHQNR